MINLNLIRNILYDILTAEDEQSAGVQATQNMGVQLTNTIKKEGVTIVQLQSVVNKTVLLKITEGLRLLDNMQSSLQIEENEQPVIELKPRTLEDIAAEKVHEGFDLKSFVDMITAVYVNAAIGILGPDRTRRQLRIRGETIKKVTG